jgi:dihydroorotase
MACPVTQGTSLLKREAWTPQESYPFGEAELKPLRSGEALPWRMA